MKTTAGRTATTADGGLTPRPPLLSGTAAQEDGENGEGSREKQSHDSGLLSWMQEFVMGLPGRQIRIERSDDCRVVFAAGMVEDEELRLIISIDPEGDLRCAAAECRERVLRDA